MAEEGEIQTHAVRRLVVEAFHPSPDGAATLSHRLSQLCAGALGETLSDVLSRHVREDEVLRLERLELDLGPVRESHLDEELPEALRRALEKALAGLNVPRPGHEPSFERITARQRQGELLRFLLLRGTLPWWCTEAPPGLEELLQGVESAMPGEARRILLEAGLHGRVRRRLALQLSEPALREVVRLVERENADFVIAYVEELERRQSAERFVPASSSDFRVAKWELVLAYLLVERGSRFSTKMFVGSTILAMARRYNVGYAELLAHLRQASREARFTRIASPLRAILEELWREEEEGALEVSGSTPSVRGEPEDEGAASAGAEEARLESSLARVAGLLARGLPTAETRAPENGFDAAFRLAAREPARLRYVLLAHWHRAQVRQRLAERPEPVLEELVRVVEPTHAAEVIGYGRHLQRTHERRPLLRSSASEFRRIRWLFFLECLLHQQGSTFNTRSFIRLTLERLAAHHNRTYGQVLAWLWRESAPMRRRAAGVHPVVLHLGALYREWLRVELPRRARGRTRAGTAASGPGPDVLPEEEDALDTLLPGFRESGHASARTGPEATRRGGVLSNAETGPEAFSAHASPSASTSALELARMERRLLGTAAEGSTGATEGTGAPEGARGSRGPVRLDVLFERALSTSPARLAVYLSRLSQTGDGRERLEREVSSEQLGRFLRVLVTPSHRTLSLAIVAFVERLPAEVGPGLIQGTHPRELQRAVRSTAVAFLLSTRGHVFTPEALLEALLRRVSALSGLSWERTLDVASGRRRRERPRSLREAVRRLVTDVARSTSAPVAPPVMTSDAIAARGLERLLLFGDRGTGRNPPGLGVWEWIDRLERETVPPERRRLAGLLRDEAARRHALLAMDDEAMSRLFSWRHSPYRADVVAALESLKSVLVSPHLSEPARVGLRQAFWRYVWTEWAVRIRGRGRLLPLFLAQLSRRDTRLHAALGASRPGAALIARTRREGSASGDGTTSEADRSAARERAARRAREPKKEEAAKEESVRVFSTPTAGLVLLSALVPSFLAKLGLLEQGQFKGTASQERAVVLLQHLASGLSEFHESDLVLPKVLCGLAPDWPVPLTLDPDDAVRSLAESLLGFVCQRWEALKNTSVQGLRGTFLCRPGQLTFADERWTLKVERKVFDILLDSCPWKQSIVKLSWMPHALHVEWGK